MTKKEIQFKTSGRISEPVVAEIERIRIESGLTPRNVVKQARDTDNPLHSFFEWNNNRAAEKYRLCQARMLVNRVEVVIEGEEIPAYENCTVKIEGSEEEETEREYFSAPEIMESEELREQIITKAVGRLKYWQKMYGHYDVFKPVNIAINEVLEANG